MTTRSYYVNTNPFFTWNQSIGDDGKYEVFNGTLRLKWNKYSVVSQTAKRTPGRTPLYIGDQWFDCTVPPSTIIKPNDILTLQSRLSEQVKGHEFNLAVSVAQGKQTVDMVVKAVHSIGGAIIDLKKGRFESAARRFGVNQKPSKLSEKDVSGRWLELQYGWLPLLSDVHEAARAYEAITNKPRVSRVTSTLTRRGTGEFSNSPTLYTCKGDLVEKVKIIYEMTEDISVARSLGLTDPLQVAWELIPYSFVVDWFVPIGSYLENLNTIPQLNGRFLTIKVRNYQGAASKGPNPNVSWIKYPTTNTSTFYMKREVSGSLSVPKPAFESLPDAMSPSRIWNALALVTQRLR